MNHEIGLEMKYDSCAVKALLSLGFRHLQLYPFSRSGLRLIECSVNYQLYLHCHRQPSIQYCAVCLG